MPTNSWTNTSSGNWSAGTNWSLGRKPAAGDDVVIDTASPVTVTYDSASSSVSVNSLTVGADNFDLASNNTLTIATSASFGALLEVDAGVLDFTSVYASIAAFAQTGGVVSGTGTLTVSGAATFSGNYFHQQSGTGTTLLKGATTESDAGYVTLDGGRVLENAGTFAVSLSNSSDGFFLGYNASGTTAGGGTIQNDSGATFDFQSAAYVRPGSGTTGFVNAGTLERTTATGTADIGVALTNTGAISVQTGTLELAGGGASTAGAITVASGASLAFGGGTFTLSGGSIGGPGAVTVTAGTLAIGKSFSDSASLHLSTSGAGALALNGYKLTLTGASNTLTGAIKGSGTLKVTRAATLTDVTAGAAGAKVTIEDAGSVTLGGADTLTGTLKIDSGATATIGGALNSSAAVIFSGTGATLSLSTPSSFSNTIGGVDFDDTIFLNGIAATSATLSGAKLVVKNGSKTVDTLRLSGNKSGFAFVTQAVTGGTNVIALPKVATVAQYLAVPSLFDLISGGFAVSDTATNISSGLDSLNDSAINSITISDNGAISTSVAQLTSDATAIGKLVNADASPNQLAVSDDLATIVGDLSGLNADTHVVSLAATSGTATLSGGETIAAPIFALSGSATALTIGENLTYTGSFSEGSGSAVTILGGDALALSGTASLAGTISGVGTLAVAGGSTTIGSGAALSVANWSVSGSGTRVTLGETLSYAGTFSVDSGAALNLSSGNLTLTGTNSFAGATTSGSGVVTAKGATTVSDLTVGGTTTFSVSGALSESGGSATVGDAAGDVAKLSIASTGTWDILDDSGIERGLAASSPIINSGVLEKTGGAGTSVIIPRVTNNGTIDVSSGTLDFTAAISGAGTDTISNGATLEFDAGVSTAAMLDSQHIDFSGTGTLNLGQPKNFYGEISDFMASDAINLLGSWAFSSFSENAAGTIGTLTLARGSVQHSFDFAGSFTATDFNIASGATTVITHA